MKFLVKVIPIEGFPPTPPEQNIKIIMAQIDYFDQLVKREKGVGGTFAGKRGGAGIMDVESPEELHAILQGAPAAGMVRFEVQALTTFEAAKKALKQQLEALKKSRM